MHLAPGHFRPQFDDLFGRRVVRFVAAYLPDTRMTREAKLSTTLVGGELAPLLREDAVKTQQTETCCEGLL